MSVAPTSLPSINWGQYPNSGPYQSLVQQTEQQDGIPPGLLAAVLQQESGYNPGATSNTGAQGIAQFEPGTAAGFGINAYDPSQAIPAAGKYLSGLANEFGGNWTLALAAYNAGPGAVQKYNGIPPYQETQNYVSSVLNMSGYTGGNSDNAWQFWGNLIAPLLGGAQNGQIGANVGSAVSGAVGAAPNTAQSVNNAATGWVGQLTQWGNSELMTLAFIGVAMALISGGILWLVQPDVSAGVNFVKNNPEVLS